ncbi:low-density lipo receptor-related 6 isoform X2 [Paramuricea clavata]|nr:low-density lipo receptor-related 6 isoform X2 [Paramuricea clavata]
MDGTGRKNVITTDVKRPKSLAVDFKDPRLFWLDAFKDYSRLESSNLDGKNRKKIISSSLRRPFSITLYGDRVFWTDRKKLSIESCNKKTGLEKWLVKDKIKKIMDLQAFEAERQPDVKNSCAIDNGGCSDLCFLAAGGNHTCACPTGIVLLDDGKTCEDVKNSCAIDNGGCSDLCLLAAGGNHTCACPTGIVLLDDGKTCEDVKNSCAIDNGGCSDFCLLAAGGNHTCTCPTGIVLLDDGKTCEDGKQ